MGAYWGPGISGFSYGSSVPTVDVGGGGGGSTPSNLPAIDTAAMKSCLNSFYSSKAGKATNLLSAGSLLWGPDVGESWLETIVGGSAKAGAIKAGEAAGAASLTTLAGRTAIASPLNALAGLAAHGLHSAAKALGGLAVGAATAVDIAAHAACANSGNSMANTMFLNQAANPSPIP